MLMTFTCILFLLSLGLVLLASHYYNRVKNRASALLLLVMMVVMVWMTILIPPVNQFVTPVISIVTKYLEPIILGVLFVLTLAVMWTVDSITLLRTKRLQGVIYFTAMLTALLLGGGLTVSLSAISY
jgi:hypothetical protein